MVRRLLLVKALQNRDHPTKLREALSQLQLAFDVATSDLNRLKRTTENTVVAIQKVGRTTKNRMGPNNHI